MGKEQVRGEAAKGVKKKLKSPEQNVQAYLNEQFWPGRIIVPITEVKIFRRAQLSSFIRKSQETVVQHCSRATN